MKIEPAEPGADVLRLLALRPLPRLHPLRVLRKGETVSDAEKKARQIVADLIEACAQAEGFTGADDTCWPINDGEWADRILRFAREYGPLIAHREGMRALEGALPGVFSPVEDTTPPGWTREPRTTLAHSTQPLPSERGKPF